MDYSIYNDAYYLHGKANGLSLYENYRWLPELTVPMVQRIAEVMGIDKLHSILDFGCARGYVVKAFRQIGYHAYGYDPSKWAIYNCDPTIKPFVTDDEAMTWSMEYEWIVAKDVLEHIPEPDLTATIDNLLTHARKGVFVVVPLSPAAGEPYVVPEYEQDITHVQRLPLMDWAEKFRREGFCTTATYLIPGVKDNYAHITEGNGFIICRKEIEAQ